MANRYRSSDPLLDAIRNLIITHKCFPAEGYEFPQRRVAEFWKEAFAERGITVFGDTEAPTGIHKISVNFTLPDEPPEWMIEKEDGTS